jgi:glutaredoxin-like YruB-family protein
VYSSPLCSWCNTLKSYLRKNRIRFTDIDISRDKRAADELVKRSGQMSTPQTDINGEIIVGFDKNKINKLLEIKN